MKRTSLKVLACTLCATLALASGLVLTGCSGADPEEAIRTDLTANLDQIKNLDDAAIDELAEEMGDTGLEDYGIETSELIASMADGFDYSIESVEVDGDTATANLTVTSKSMSELMNLDYDEMTNDLMSAIESGEVTADEEGINAWAGTYIMDLVNGIEPSEKSLELTYVNGDDGWELDANSNNAVSQIFI